MLNCFSAASRWNVLLYSHSSRVYHKLSFKSSTLFHSHSYHRQSMPRLSSLVLTSSPSCHQRRTFSSVPAANSVISDIIPHTFVDFLYNLFTWKWFSAKNIVDKPDGSTIDNLANTVNEVDGNIIGDLLTQSTHGSIWDTIFDVSKTFEEIFIVIQDTLGVDAWVVLLLTGVVTRLITLLFSLYSDRASARLQMALVELKPAHETFSEIYYRPESSALDVHLAATLLKNERRRIYKKYKTSMWQSLSFLYGTPFVLFSLTNVSALCQNINLNVGTSSFYWCYALTFPDPLYILPITFCALTLLNFELSVNDSLKRSEWMRSIVWGARIVCVTIFPVAITFQSGVCLYFVGMSLTGLLQPLLLRWEPFRKFCRFPSLNELHQLTVQNPNRNINLASKNCDKENIVSGVASHRENRFASGRVVNTTCAIEDDVQARVLLQFPELSHLFRPLTNDMIDNQTTLPADRLKNSQLHNLIKGSKITSITNNINHNEKAANAKFINKYRPGENPLMREVPLHTMTSNQTSLLSQQHLPKRNSSHKSSSSSSLTLNSMPNSKISRQKGKLGDAWKSANLIFDENDMLEFYKAENTDNSDTCDNNLSSRSSNQKGK